MCTTPDEGILFLKKLFVHNDSRCPLGVAKMTDEEKRCQSKNCVCGHENIKVASELINNVSKLLREVSRRS
jgi:hypothetical protein